jgi:hypothetical protein
VPKGAAEKVSSLEGFSLWRDMKSSLRFKSDELLALEQDMSTATSRSLAIEIQLFESLSQLVMNSSELLLSVGDSLAEIDVSSALSEVSRDCNYCRPRLDDSSRFDVEEGRHRNSIMHRTCVPYPSNIFPHGQLRPIMTIKFGSYCHSSLACVFVRMIMVRSCCGDEPVVAV